MEEDVPPILARAKFSNFEENNAQISDRKSVELMKAQGLITRKIILERFTTEIYSTLLRDKMEQVDNIKKNFQALKATRSTGEVEVVSKSSFTAFLSQNFHGFENFVLDGILAVYESARVYGNFPFPPETETFELTFEQFLRAVAFMWDTQPYHPESTFYTHESFMGSFGDISGDLGPHSGAYVHSRHRSHQDRRRLDFRALAIKISNKEPSNKELSNARISITYFKEYASDEGFGDTHLELDFADEEDERGVDIVDVLSAVYPKDPDPMMGPPMLCSLRSVTRDLSRQPYYLYELRIPYSKLFGLVKLLLLVQLEEFGDFDSYFPNQTEDLNVLAKWIMNSFSRGEDISWESFDEVMKRNLPTFLLGSLHHLARPFLSTPGRDRSPCIKPLLPFSSIHNNILTYPLLAQLHTFFPAHSGDIKWNNLHGLLFHSRLSPLTFSAIQSVLHNYQNPTILLLSGYQIDLLNPSSKTYVIVGALIRSPWTETETEYPGDTRLWKTMLFQLAPVQRVYATRKGYYNPFPVLQPNGIGIGREVDNSVIETELGTTSLIVNAELEKTYLEHGKRNSRDGAFEGFCPFGVGNDGLLRIEISKLEVWGC